MEFFVHIEPLFWIYYPEARPILAKAEVFNFKNGAERLSYDDVFWKRLFASYVYKEENVFDRKITDYATRYRCYARVRSYKT